MVMEIEQELAWSKAQKIVLSADLVEAAKRQLQFLAAVDRMRCLYNGPVLKQSIYRYKYCWLPLLAKYNLSHVSEAFLVVPLDCEWIWHCHRLNPVQYKIDCEELYGSILDNSNVLSSVQGTSTEKTKEIWNKMYPSEPYDLDIKEHLSESIVEKTFQGVRTTNYDLAAAVKRQSSFTYQVSRPHMNDETFLKEAVARYKGFLYLIKKNRQNSTKRFCVPTYDIDLIWHSHQLQPASYCKDMEAITGNVLQHDDTDSDRSSGGKLSSGFLQTTKLWEETFGWMYWKAGAMNRGSAPSILSSISHPPTMQVNDAITSMDHTKIVQLPKKELVEVMIEIVSARRVPCNYKGNLFVSLSKGCSDMLLNTRKNLNIFSESGKKQIAHFCCEADGELVFELMASSPSTILEASHAPATFLGSASISLADLIHPASKLFMKNWFDLNPNLKVEDSATISLLIALSFTPPVPAPYTIHMIRPHPSSKNAIFLDENGNEIINLQMRDITRTKEKYGYPQAELIKSSTYCKTHMLAEFNGASWSFMNSSWSFRQQENSGEDGIIFELIGNQKVILFPGKKLEYESSSHGKQEADQSFATGVEFSTENPYGKGIALLNLTSGMIEIKEEWMILPTIISMFIICNTVIEKDHGGFSKAGTNKERESNALSAVNMCSDKDWKIKKAITRKMAVIGEVGRKSMIWIPKHIGQSPTKISASGCFGGSCSGGGCSGGCQGNCEGTACGGCHASAHFIDK